MGWIEIFLTGIGLSMDCFAVSICKGLGIKKIDISRLLKMSIVFGVSHVLALLIGYYVGVLFHELISNIDHWVAFVLLLMIGINMIRETKSKKKNNEGMGWKALLLLAIAVSIDALVVGISFAMLDVNIWLAVSIIGGITFGLSMLGIFIGCKTGNKFGNKVQILGGIILICIGLKILIEHLGII